MNVLLLTDEMDPTGTARHVVDLANGLHKAGVGVVVAATDGTFRQQLDKNISFFPLRLTDKGHSRKPIWGFIAAVVSLYTIVRRYNINVIHSHKRYTDLLGRVVARLTGRRHVSTCHSVFNDHKLLSLYGDVTIACSKAVVDQLVGFFGFPAGRISMVYSGCRPFRRFSEAECIAARKTLGLEPGLRLIASVGHFSPAKDRRTLLESITIIKEKIREHNAIVAVVGEGEERDDIRNAVEKNALKDIVRFYLAGTDVESIMNISEFLVLSSVQEGLPYVILEAASLSKPHVATSVGGIPEFVVDGETGLLVPPRNGKALGEAIERLLSHPKESKKLGANARRRFDEFHSMKRFISDTLLIYERVLKG